MSSSLAPRMRSAIRCFPGFLCLCPCHVETATRHRSSRRGSIHLALPGRFDLIRILISSRFAELHFFPRRSLQMFRGLLLLEGRGARFAGRGLFGSRCLSDWRRWRNKSIAREARQELVGLVFSKIYDVLGLYRLFAFLSRIVRGLPASHCSFSTPFTSLCRSSKGDFAGSVAFPMGPLGVPSNALSDLCLSCVGPALGAVLPNPRTPTGVCGAGARAGGEEPCSTAGFFLLLRRSVRSVSVFPTASATCTITPSLSSVSSSPSCSSLAVQWVSPMKFLGTS
ncbi:hypothetical protein KC324_g30 [Hortaea werneckii]|nr:hypothetical protein KC324_g30 [Hortaea werneckii]